MMKAIYYIAVFVNLISCNNDNLDNKVNFCKLKTKHNIFLIDKRVDDTLLLKKEVEKFIFERYIDTIRTKKMLPYIYFYERDEYLTCDFEEGKPYKIVPWHMTLDSIQDLRNHRLNQIMFLWIDFYEKDSVWYYNYWLRSSDEYDILENTKRLKINDIDSLFEAKQKEYGIK
ncbi:hypothetical protein [Capnocytophaga canimorsus]|uniref:hypothetical protein n=1 Tax=Capnocytophaga canimorsus TaxID=28188 RepID=UPI000D6E1D95|nr:hypothetical protein [Capnocytophaga canimorsus]AWL78011.1 hypothetical protein DKB58_03120 [Capnocytophaga canimorsus]MDT9499313.1 hypothetical protein [Capnocytophaga canimorsus]